MEDGLGAVELLQDLDGQPDFVILKMKERLRVVHQDVGIEDVMFVGGDFGFFGDMKIGQAASAAGPNQRTESKVRSSACSCAPQKSRTSRTTPRVTSSAGWPPSPASSVSRRLTV